jgi:trigger factor
LIIDKQFLDDHQVKLTVEVEPDLFEGAKRQAAREISKRYKIAGFRPGKAPYAVVVRQVGEAAIVEESIHLLVDDIYPKVIEDADIRPYGPGNLNNIVSTDPPVFEFVVPLEAEVALGNYKSIRRTYEPLLVSDNDVDELIENLRDRQSVLEPAERPAEIGDVVTIRLSADHLNATGEQNPVLIRERSVPITLRPDMRMNEQMRRTEWPFEGFSRGLIGLSVNDERDIHNIFPEDYTFESMRGVEEQYHFVVEEIKAKILPALDDDFAKGVGDFETLDALQLEVRSSLEEQAKNEYNEKFDEQVLDELIDQSTFKYPPQMLEDEIDSVIEGFTRRLQNQGTELNLYLKTRGLDMEGLRDETRPVAEKHLKRSLALMELAKVENIQVEPEELQSETVRTVDALSQSLSEREARRLSDQRVYNNLMSNIMVNLVTERAQKRLRAIASGEFTSESETDIDLLSTGDLKSVELEAKLETTPEEQQVIEDILVPVEEVKLINEEKGEL